LVELLPEICKPHADFRPGQRLVDRDNDWGDLS
jgi:hypothetical protein